MVWHKHDLVIFSLIVSGYLYMYSCEFPHEYLSGWENLSGKAISIKYNFPFSQISQLFQDSFIFGEATSPHFFKVTIRHNSCFFGAAISSEQLVFWGVPISKQ